MKQFIRKIYYKFKNKKKQVKIDKDDRIDEVLSRSSDDASSLGCCSEDSFEYVKISFDIFDKEFNKINFQLYKRIPENSYHPESCKGNFIQISDKDDTFYIIKKNNHIKKIDRDYTVYNENFYYKV